MILRWIFPLLYYRVLSFVYNIEEIEHLKYGIEINSETPILRSQLPDQDVEHVIIRTKYDQEYSCVLPNVATKEHKDTELESVFRSFAARFMTNMCIHRTKGWWTYRVCYGNAIQQYHQPNRRLQGVIPPDVTILGKYEKDMNWTQELQNPSIKYYEQLPVAHKQYFTNGDFCEDSGANRKATVSYVCDPDATQDFIALIDERSVCVYKIVIHTARMCRHPFFMPGHSAVKHRISCSPIVNQISLPTVSEFEPGPVLPSLLEPSWVGNQPTSENYSLKEYLEDISDEKKQAPLRKLKKMFRAVVEDLKKDVKSLKKLSADGIKGDSKHPELSEINWDVLSDEDLNKLFQSEELESTIQRLAKSTHQQVQAETMKHMARQSHQQNRGRPPVEIKVIYRDADGNVKISDADGNSPAIHESVLQLMASGTEERVETARQRTMQNAYHFVDPSKDNPPEQSGDPTVGDEGGHVTSRGNSGSSVDDDGEP